MLLWLVIVASLGNASALTPGTTETCVGEKTFETLATRQAEPLETAGRHQENGSRSYEVAPDSLLAAEGGVQSELASAEENLGVVPDGKTVAADAFGRRTLSGWTDTQGFLPSSQQVNDVMAKANEIGFQFKSHIFDNGVPGRYFASHAEPQLSLNSGTFMVSKDMCSSCRSFMSARSVAEGTTFIVQDPTRIWTFSPTSTSWMWK